MISGQSLLAISVIIVPTKTRADSWTAALPLLLLHLLPLLLLLTQNHWVSPGRGVRCWMVFLSQLTEEGLFPLMTTDWLTNWQTLCLAEYDVEVNRGHIWLQDLVWFPYQCHFFFSLWFILGFSNFRNRINTGDMLHKYSGHRMLNPFLKLHTLCSAFLHSPKLLLWFHVMQCKRVMADHFGTKTGKDCLLSKVTGLSLLFPRSYAGLPDWFE